MDGKADLVRLSAFIGRVRGAPVTPHQELTLRSVERAALASWIRRENVPIRAEYLNSGAPFRIEQLLSAEAPEGHPVQALPKPAETVGAGHVGVDMEEIDNLPMTDDYREHPFYADHFTPAEIAYCICQADVRASFCGIWAAKEAIMKTGLVDMAIPKLKAIEITHSEDGRPTFRNCSISISHTPRAAVAVCLVL